MNRVISRTLYLPLALSLGLLAGCADEGANDTGSDGEKAIRLMFIGQITDTANATPIPEAAAGVRAAVASINAEGGLNGRPLRVEICDDKNDANEATKCARRAARDGVVATVGNTSNFGDMIMPVLEQAGIVSIGHNPIMPRDFASPAAYPLQPGAPGMLSGAAKMLADQGVKRIRLAAVDSPAGALGEPFVRAGLKGTDSELVGMTLVPLGAPDYSIYARAIFQDADGVVLGMNADQAARTITALRQADPDKPIAVTMAALPPATIEQLGAAAEGVLVATPFRPMTAGGDSIARFIGDMGAAAPDAKLNGFSLQGWLAVQTLHAVMRDTPADGIDAAAVRARMASLENFAVGDALAPLTTTREKTDPFNRLFNSTVLYGRVSGGEIVLIDDKWREANLNE
ncbi:MAG: ABC transporter substrate-binding protein [Porticoccaceae bacterium]|jgi:branched-chain amino acid transport system substrate-binding protein|nr:ABC transporter substrate-binding protein [Porticoccaceae bacterium]